MVNGKCIRFGDPNMTIKKNQPGRKKSFCARHRCSQKRNKATPGYQSCKKWSCPNMHAHSKRKSPARSPRRKSPRRKSPKRKSHRRKSPRRSPRRSPAKRSARRSPNRKSPQRSLKKSYSRSKKRSVKRKSRCWRGYEPVPGKKAYSKGSCRKIRR